MELRPIRNQTWLIAIGFFIYSLFGHPFSYAENSNPPLKTPLEGLKWTAQTFTEDENQLLLRLSGVFSRPHWNLLFFHQPIQVNFDQTFQVLIPIKQQQFDVKVVAIGPFGQIESRTFQIRVPESVWNHHLDSNSDTNSNRFGLSGNLGWTYLDYQEDINQLQLSEVSLTTKLNAHYKLIPNQLTLSGSIFANVLPVYFSSASTTQSARFFGVSGRIGYQLPIPTSGVIWSLLGGWYVWGMLVSNQAYGVKQLAGPMAMIHAKIPTALKRPTYAYFKFAPISTQGGQISFQYRELAFGLGHQLNAPHSGRDWTLTLDLSHTQASSIEAQNSLKLLSLSLGIQSSLF
jgi:hypothetical protein